VRERDIPDEFFYYHIERDDHALIFAENTLAETFVDNVDRARFDNWHEHKAQHREGKIIEEMPFPRAKSARQVPATTRARLARRAAEIFASGTASSAA
jgi:serralysin